MSATPIIGITEMAENQAQAHVTMNEALRLLEAILQLSVIDRDLDEPPGSPNDGDRYLVADHGPFNISGVNQGTDTFQFSTLGDETGNMPVGSTFEVFGSTGNDGTYTVESRSFSLGTMSVVVVEEIPNSTADGQVRWAEGDWNGHHTEIAIYKENSWEFVAPYEGLRMWVRDEDLLLIYDGSDWDEQVITTRTALNSQSSTFLAGIVRTLTTFTVDLNVGTDQTIYTVPAGFKLIVLDIVMREPTANAATGVIRIRRASDNQSIAGSRNLTNFTATDHVITFMRNSRATATPVEYRTLAAGDSLKCDMTTTIGVAGTCKLGVIGYLMATGS